MSKSIKLRIAAAEKSLGDCECYGGFTIRVSSSPDAGRPATCERCGRDLRLVVVLDPYALRGGAHE